MVVHKFEVIEGKLLDMPRGAIVLHVGTQSSKSIYGNEGIFVWAMVDPEEPIVQRLIVPYGTGHGMHPAATAKKFVGTVQFKTMPMVVHVFDLGETDEDGMPLDTN